MKYYILIKNNVGSSRLRPWGCSRLVWVFEYLNFGKYNLNGKQSTCHARSLFIDINNITGAFPPMRPHSGSAGRIAGPHEEMAKIWKNARLPANFLNVLQRVYRVDQGRIVREPRRTPLALRNRGRKLPAICLSSDGWTFADDGNEAQSGKSDITGDEHCHLDT